jgi:hypothetical protein
MVQLVLLSGILESQESLTFRQLDYFRVATFLLLPLPTGLATGSL